MTIEKPPVEDVVPIKTGDFPASHVGFHGCVTTIQMGILMTCSFFSVFLPLRSRPAEMEHERLVCEVLVVNHLECNKKRFVTRGKDSTVSLLWPSFWPGVTAKSGSISFAGTEAIPVFHWIWTGIMYRFEPAEGNNRTDLDIHLESCGINISTEEGCLPHGLVWRNHPPGLVVV